MLTGENIQVVMESFVQGKELLPIPLEEQGILTVEAAIGHVLTWPRHLVQKCSDLVIVLFFLNNLYIFLDLLT